MVDTIALCSLLSLVIGYPIPDNLGYELVMNIFKLPSYKIIISVVNQLYFKNKDYEFVVFMSTLCTLLMKLLTPLTA